MVSNLEIRQVKKQQPQSSIQDSLLNLFHVISPIIVEMLEWTKTKQSKGEIKIIFGCSKNSQKYQICQNKSSISFFDAVDQRLLSSYSIPVSHQAIEDVKTQILDRLKPTFAKLFNNSHFGETEVTLLFRHCSLVGVHSTSYDNTNISVIQVD